jgi:hypothetical protein
MTANKARRSFLSYSSNGHVAIDALQSELASIGAVRIVSLGSIRAYAPSSVPSVSNVSEFLIRFERSAVAAVA